MKHTLIFVFLDGVGLGDDTAANPLADDAMPALTSFLETPLVRGSELFTDRLLFKGIDACLAVPGIPQSATGQTALLTGINAAHSLGQHYPAFPNEELIQLIRQHNLYDKAAFLGRRSLFANAYSTSYFDDVKTKKRRVSVTTHALLAAGLPILTLDDLVKGKAVFWDITRTALSRFPLSGNIPTVEPETAARHLVGLASDADLIVFECFLPDVVGHKRNPSQVRQTLRIIDRFLSEIIETLPQDVTLLVTSDHGNIEDLSTGQHTVNPVPLLVTGPAACFFNEAESLVDITPSLLRALE
ncbi:MAG TPA: phosphoglyceromutase [Spirochaetia bacterium]|nr:phosphoglyceromutase [Spirochaetia bacterium]